MCGAVGLDDVVVPVSTVQRRAQRRPCPIAHHDAVAAAFVVDRGIPRRLAVIALVAADLVAVRIARRADLDAGVDEARSSDRR